MVPIYAVAFLLGIFALGDIIAQKTKAMISTVLVIVIALLVGFWVGLPANIMNYSGVSAVAMPMAAVLIVGIGSTIDVKTFIKQWKTVLISLFGAIGGVLTIMFLGQFVMGRYMAFVAGPVFAGANAAILILIDALTNNEMVHLIPFILLVFVTDNLIGIPIASIVLKKEAKLFIKDKEKVAKYAKMSLEGATKTKRLINMPEIFNKPSVIFLRIALVASLSFYVSTLTQGRLHFLVACLILGVIFTEIGFLEKQSLQKTESYGFVVFVTTVFIFGSLADTSPTTMLSLIGPLLVTIGAGFLGLIVVSVAVSKLLGVSYWMGIAMATSCSFGMPTTFLIPKEVANAIGTTQEEKAAIENYMVPNMITAGFTSVTIASVFIAQFAISILFG